MSVFPLVEKKNVLAPFQKNLKMDKINILNLRTFSAVLKQSNRTFRHDPRTPPHEVNI